MIELKLREAGGQRCQVVIVRRDDGSVYVRFESQQGYGFPSLELDELRALLSSAENLQGRVGV